MATLEMSLNKVVYFKNMSVFIEPYLLHIGFLEINVPNMNLIGF